MYFDTSALVKLFVKEPGSEWVAGCWEDSSGPFTSTISFAEVRAALAAANRAGRLSDAAHRDAKNAFDGVWSELGLVTCDSVLAELAGAQAEVSALRGGDAIQLASALALHEREPLLMLSYDSDLAEASFNAGINVIRTTAS